MYWINSLYTINSLPRLTFLMNLFSKVNGELEIFENLKLVKKIEWTANPMKNLADSFNKYQNISIKCRFCGPDTIMAVAPKLIKLNPHKFSFHKDRKDAIMEWSQFIEKQIKFEMSRSTDICLIFPTPKIQLLSIEELLLATQLTEHCSHALIGTNNCILAFNEKSVYHSSISLNDNHIPNCMFDADDGFISPYDKECYQLEYMNKKFLEWKNNNYTGKLSDYCIEYDNYFEK